MVRLRSMTRLLTALTVLACLFASAALAAEPLRVCATVSELGSLAEEIGGADVAVTVFTKGTESPHFTVPKPSFIRALNACHVYVQIGLELEIGWAPALLQSARNADILPGRAGFIDASEVISALGVPSGQIDRSMGDVHPGGNPHYLLDPLNGLRVAGDPSRGPHLPMHRQGMPTLPGWRPCALTLGVDADTPVERCVLFTYTGRTCRMAQDKRP